jgi:hypothetical protein
MCISEAGQKKTSRVHLFYDKEEKMKKRLKAAMLIMLLLFMELVFPNQDVWAASTSSYSPYAKIEYNYSSGVTCGTIRYISQVPGGSHYNSAYWPAGSFGGYKTPKEECLTASISMALSYIGINKIPKTILEANNGVAYCTGWGATYQEPSLSTGISNYINGNGKYSPVVIHLPQYSSAGHYLLIIGKISNTSYQILDPWECSVTTMTISGSTATYTKRGTTITENIDQVIQWYNSSASTSNSSTSTSSIKTGRRISDGTYYIKSAVNSSYYLNVNGNSKSNKANINISTTKQKFKVTYLSDGSYKIVSENSGKCLDVEGGIVDSGKNVIQYTYNGTSNQQ